ncbi:MAG: FKBP-type peptidyl-prolyl cis-trans isomerase [bacterium]|nr:FKBP-type peptidyl-prolyl cis-trans isomerase [bacterium]
MKKITVCTVLWVALSLGLQGADDTNAPTVATSATPTGPDMKKVSYAIGYKMGHNMKQQGMELVQEDYARGFADGQAGADAVLSEDEMDAQLSAFQADMMTKMQARRESARARNLSEGRAFLEANAKKEGWKTTKSGLQYKVITEGKGPKPSATDTVVVHYRGTLIDGKEFDSSYRRGQPATFPVNGVIKGWTEALQMMPVGSKWQLVLPPELAYGERGAGPDIGPNAVLCFEVELLDIQK